MNKEQFNNQGQNDVESPVNRDINPAFQTDTPQVSMDTGNGLSHSGESVFGTEVKEIQSFQFSEVRDISTLPLTDAESIYITPTKDQGEGQIIPANPEDCLFTNELSIMEYFDKRQAKPTMVTRGMNHLLPFGATHFARILAGDVITTLNSEVVSAAATSEGALIANLKTPGSFKELPCFKRIQELKNVIISYFNRSIPFTDLSDGDRFAIEICYMSDIALAMLPILGKVKALAIVKRWQKLGYQYDPSVLTNLNSQSAEVFMKSIYSAIANLTSLDDSLLDQLIELSRLYTTSAKEGFAGCIIDQDVAIARLGNYALEGVNASSGYKITTKLGLNNAKSIEAMSLNSWVEFWLRSDVHPESQLLEVLDDFSQMAHAIRTNYNILLACMQQLATRGAVNYKPISEFLPVEGVTDYCLKYVDMEAEFSYTYKERFEYAPRIAVGESGEGTNTTFRFNLLDNLSETDNIVGSEVKFRRPVGLFKKDVWGTREIAHIGLFKRGALNYLAQSSNVFTAEILATKLGITLTSLSGSVGAVFVDAYFGNYYSTDNYEYALESSGTAATRYVCSSEIVSYYGFKAQNAKYSTARLYFTDGGNNTDRFTINDNGVQLLDFYSLDLSESSTYGYLLANQIQALLTQMDLTLYIGQTANPIGRVSQPLFIFSGYRGAFFDAFDVSVINNALADSYNLFALPMKPKAFRQQQA